MASERLKFRCYQCNQLLASSPGKAGSTVSCPRCKADLVVPAPDSTGEADPDPGAVGKAFGRATATLSPPKPSSASYLDEVAAAIPADLADLRPEDLRVEAEFFHSLTREPELPNDPEKFPTVAQRPASPLPSLDPGPIAAPAPAYPEFGIPAARTQGLETPGAVPWLAPTTPTIKPFIDVPPIEIDSPSIVAPDRASRPIHDVVLPASVVLAWSLFGLIGIAMSFIAGLMIGHYFWRM